MSTILENNKRIAKNTLLLYFRMIVTVVISLFTARYTLQLLGTEDYGINNVVGGLIGFMGVIIITMESATQRFLAFNLGCGDNIQFRKTFSMLLNIFIVFCTISTILLEVAGPLFISRCLVIPPERLIAAQWIFQFSVILFILGTVTIPYTSSIVSYEKMGVYAYFTILDVISQLLSVVVLFYTPFDRLISFGFLITFMAAIRIFLIIDYCHRKLDGCNYIFFWDKVLFKKMIKYAGWNMFGSTTSFLNTQGQSILLNLFFGPVVNAAKGIADRINTTITSFSGNFYMAVTPQIIKTYAMGDTAYTKKLVINSSKYACFLLSMLSLPLIFNMKPLLQLWLGENIVSNDMVIFSKLILVYSLINVLENPVTQAVRATGNIKKYQITIGIQTLMFLPICFILFKMGYPAYYSMIVLSIIYFIVQFWRVKIVSPILDITMTEYIQLVIIPIIATILFSSVIIHFILFFESTNLGWLILRIGISFIINVFCIIYIGLNRKERAYVLQVIHKKITLLIISTQR